MRAEDASLSESVELRATPRSLVLWHFLLGFAALCMLSASRAFWGSLSIRDAVELVLCALAIGAIWYYCWTGALNWYTLLDEDGIHIHGAVGLGSHRIAERHIHVRWENVHRFWKGQRRLAHGYLWDATDENGKRIIGGITAGSTNQVEGVRFILRHVPPGKLAPELRSELSPEQEERSWDPRA